MKDRAITCRKKRSDDPRWGFWCIEHESPIDVLAERCSVETLIVMEAQ